MKKTKYLIAILCFIGLAALGQENTVSGKIKNVRPYNDQCAMNVGKMVLVLVKDSTRTGFQVNAAYKDLVINRDGKLILNPKYARKKFKIVYYVNGKGWKCIKEIEPLKK